MDAQGTTPATDDTELASMLAGLNNDSANGAVPTAPPTAAPDPTVVPDPTTVAGPAAPLDPMTMSSPADPMMAASPPAPAPTMTAPDPVPSTGNPELDTIKKDALEELRPLVDKLDLPDEEQFNTLLLIIRSTDDQSLLTQAHTAAKAIPDDAKRAQALLDIIKEIDFFGQGQS
jgi:hypothetical protein